MKSGFLKKCFAPFVLSCVVLLPGCSDYQNNNVTNTFVSSSSDAATKAQPEAILDGSMWKDRLKSKVYVLGANSDNAVLIAENCEGISSVFIQEAGNSQSDFAPSNTVNLQPNAVLDGSMWKDRLKAKVYEVQPNDKTFAIIVENPEGISLDAITLSDGEVVNQNTPKSTKIEPSTILNGSMWKDRLKAKVYFYVPERVSGVIAVITENCEGISVELASTDDVSLSLKGTINEKTVLDGSMWKDRLKAKVYDQDGFNVAENSDGISVTVDSRGMHP